MTRPPSSGTMVLGLGSGRFTHTRTAEIWNPWLGLKLPIHVVATNVHAGNQTRHRNSTINEELSLQIYYYSKYHTNIAEKSRINGVMD